MKGISPPIKVAKLSGVVVFNDSITEDEVWQDLDLSAYVGANAALCFFEVYFTTPSIAASFGMKPKGFGGAYSKHYAQGRCCRIPQIDDDEYSYAICFTNNNGFVEITGDSFATVGNFRIKLVGFIK